MLAYNGSNFTPPPGATGNSVTLGNADGFQREGSQVLQVPIGGAANVAKFSLILDIGYGMNSYINQQAKYNSTVQPGADGIVSTAICYGTYPGGYPMPPVKKITQFKHSSQAVFIYDGYAENQWWQAYRISGMRHGKPNPAHPQGTVAGTAVINTGLCNVLFLDGHVDAVPRGDLPTDGTGAAGPGWANKSVTYTEQQFDCGRNYMCNANYIWSLSQEY
jgi:prepilin-type processing-associated H-X9-DG protein